MSETDELKILLPEEIYPLESGEIVVVRPVPFGKLRVVSEAVARLLGKLRAEGMAIESIDDWRRLFDLAFEEIVGLMGLILEKPRSWFDAITLGDGLGLLELIVRQNFNEAAKKNLRALLGQARGLWPTPSNSSSPPATPGATFGDTRSSRSSSSPGPP